MSSTPKKEVIIEEVVKSKTTKEEMRHRDSNRIRFLDRNTKNFFENVYNSQSFQNNDIFSRIGELKEKEKDNKFKINQENQQKSLVTIYNTGFFDNNGMLDNSMNQKYGHSKIKDILTPRISNKSKYSMPKLTIPKTARGIARKDESFAIIKPIAHKELYEEQKPNSDDFNGFQSDHFLSLHYFYDDSGDEDVFKYVEHALKFGFVEAETVFSYDSVSLEWKKCLIYEMKNREFFIKWDNNMAMKKVYRVSLRFSFENREIVSKKRRDAFLLRNMVEKEIKRDIYLQSRIKFDNIKQRQTMGMLNSIFGKITNNQSIIKDSSSKLPEIIYDLSNMFFFVQEVADYQEEWKVPEKAVEYQKQGLIKFKYSEWFPQIVNPINLNKYKIVLLPSRESNLLEAQILQVLSYSLSDFSIFKNQVINDYSIFFEQQKNYCLSIADRICQVDIINLISHSRCFLDENRNSERSQKILTMIDFKIIGCIEELIRKSINSFIPSFLQANICFRIEIIELIHRNLCIDQDLVEYGKQFIDLMLNSFNNSIISSKFLAGEDFHLKINQNILFNISSSTKEEWEKMIINSYRTLFDYISMIKTNLNHCSMVFEDCFQNIKFFDSFNLAYMIECIDQSFKDINKAKDYAASNPSPNNLVFNYDIGFSIEIIYQDLCKIKNNMCNQVSQYIINELSIVQQSITSIESLFESCPSSIEEYSRRHLVLNQIENTITEFISKIQLLLPCYGFLDHFNDDSTVTYSGLYNTRIRIQLLNSNQNKYKESESLFIGIIINKHQNDKDDLNKQLENLLLMVRSLSEYNEIDQSSEVIPKLEHYQDELLEFKSQASLFQQRDEMMNISIFQYPLLSSIQYHIDLYRPFWMIANLLIVQVDQWMSLPFFSLNPTNIIETVQGWEQILLEIMSVFESNPEIASRNRNSDSNLLSLGRSMLNRITWIISHLPILQNLCNSSLRNRHWIAITQETGFSINQSEGYTWNWIIESNIERYIASIVKIVRSAIGEYKVEKGLLEMMNDIQQLSISLKNEKDGIKIEDTTTIFEVLSSHQLRIHEFFVPPYNKPFMTKIAEYESLTLNIKEMVSKIINTQSSIVSLSPALLSQDIQKQQSSISALYMNSVKQFKNIVSNCGDQASFFDLVSNPKYQRVLGNLETNVEKIKDDLEIVLKEKRRICPYFRLLSDSQIVYILSNVTNPHKIAHIFHYIYSSIQSAVFSQSGVCTGFISTNGEEVHFINPVMNSPDSIEKLFIEFHEEMIFTMKQLTKKNHKNFTHTSVQAKLSMPSQISLLITEIVFYNRVMDVFESANNIFSDRKHSFLENQWNSLLNNIESDLSLYMKEVKSKPCVSGFNLINVLIRHKRIISIFLKDFVDSPVHISWLRTPKFFLQEDLNGDIDIRVSIGLYYIQYGFIYTGNNPLICITDEIEQLFSFFMESSQLRSLPLVYGPLYCSKISLIKMFIRILGLNSFVYSCSTTTTIGLFSTVFENTQLCNMFLVLRDISQLKKEVLHQLILFLFDKNNQSIRSLYISATYTLSEYDEIFKSCQFCFCFVNTEQIMYEKVIEYALYGIGFTQSPVLMYISNLFFTYAFDDSSPLSQIFSLQNIICILLESKIDDNNIANDLYTRFSCRINSAIDPNNKIKNDLKTLFGINRNENLIRPLQRPPSIPNNLQPTKYMQERYDSLITILNHSRDVIVLGPMLSGKSYFIKKAANYMGSELIFINPYAQEFERIAGTKENGILYHILSFGSPSKWIVFDGPCCDEWMSIMSITNSEANSLFFNDGTHFVFPKNTKIIYETDSIEKASPSLLSHCSIFSILESSIDIEQQVSIFVEKLRTEYNLVEPLSQTIIGTNTPIQKLFDLISLFVLSIVSGIMDFPYSSLFSKQYSVNSFFKIFHSILYVHYFSDFPISVFKGTKPEYILDDVVQFGIFSIVWSFGSMIPFNKRDSFENNLLDLLKQSSYSIFKKNHSISIFDVYYDPNTKIWRSFESIQPSQFLHSGITPDNIMPECFLLPNKQVSSFLYLSDCLLSQNHSIYFDCDSSFFREPILHILSSSLYVSSRYHPIKTQNCLQLTYKSLVEMLNRSVNSDNIDARSFSKLPLIQISSYSPNLDHISEFIRYISDHHSFIDFSDFSSVNCNGASFLLSGNQSKTSYLNKRFFSGFVSLAIDSFKKNTQRIGISNVIETILKISNSQDFLSMIRSLYNNIVGNMKGFQRWAYRYLQTLKIMTSFANTSQIPFIIMSEISYSFGYVLEEQKIRYIDEFFKNTISFFDIRGVENYQLVKSNMYIIFESQFVQFNGSFDSATTFLTEIVHSHSSKNPNIFFQYFDPGFKFNEKFTKEKNSEILYLIKNLSTPNRHVIIKTNCENYVNEILDTVLVSNNTCVIKIDYSVSIFDNIRTQFLDIGKNNRPLIIIIGLDYLQSYQEDQLELILKSPFIYGFISNSMVVPYIKTLLTNFEEDPFKEETLESRLTFTANVHQYIMKCYMNTHFVLVSTSMKEQRFSNLCQSINFNFNIGMIINNQISTILVPLFRQYSLKYDSSFIQTKIEAIINNLFRLNEDVISAIDLVFNTYLILYPKIIDPIIERIAVLSSIDRIREQTEINLQRSIQVQMKMEQEVQSIANEINVLFDQNVAAESIAKEDRMTIEEEEKTLFEEQRRVQILQNDLEESLKKTNILLEDSTKELNKLSSRDISIIKTMNHPPKGVMLVMKAIVVIMGEHFIDNDAEDIRSPTSSWIIGKKLLSDPSFVTNLMKRALEDISDETLRKLNVFIEDPNFVPSIIESSSTAAKSICAFIRAVIPYNKAFRIFKEKKESVKKYQEHLRVLEEKHDRALRKLDIINQECYEIEKKSRILQQKKNKVESQLIDSKNSLFMQQQSMEIVQSFFSDWKNELLDLLNRHDNLSLFVLVLSCYIGFYSIVDFDRRELVKDRLIETFPNIDHPKYFQEVFKTFGIGSKIDCLSSIDMKNWRINEFILRNHSKKWFMVRDVSHYFVYFSKRVIPKKITFISYLSTDFINILTNSIRNNDFLVICDYNTDMNDHNIKSVYDNIGKSTKIDGKSIDIPIDFQITFIISRKPSRSSFYNAIYIDFEIDASFMVSILGLPIFSFIDSESSYEFDQIFINEIESSNEMKRNKAELEEQVLSSGSSILHNINLMKAFNNSTKMNSILIGQKSKNERRIIILREKISQVVTLSKPLWDIYKERSECLDFHGYEQLVLDSITKIRFDNFSDSKIISALAKYVRNQMIVSYSLRYSFDKRVRYLLKSNSLEATSFEDAFKVISKHYENSNVLIEPSSFDSFLRISSNRRPIILSSNYLIFKYMIMSEKSIVTPIEDCSKSYINAIKDNKSLVTICSNSTQIVDVLGVLSSMITSSSLPQDFRFIIFVDEPPSSLNIRSYLLYSFDFIDMDYHRCVKQRIPFLLGALSNTEFENNNKTIPSKSWKRFLILAAFYDTCINHFLHYIIQDHHFNEASFFHIASIANKMIEFDNGYDLIGLYVSQLVYCPGRPDLYSLISSFWKRIFSIENFNNSQVTLFGEYFIPVSYNLSELSSITENYPMTDNYQIYHYSEEISELFGKIAFSRWNSYKANRISLNLQDLPPIQASDTVWYLQTEVDYANKQLAKMDIDYSVKFLSLLKMVRSSSPVVDLYLLRSPYIWFNFVMSKCSISQNLKISNICPLLVVNRGDFDLNNIALVNFEFNIQNGFCSYRKGIQIQKRLSIKVVEYHPSFQRVSLFHQSKCIVYICIRSKDLIPNDNMFLLTLKSELSVK